VSLSSVIIGVDVSAATVRSRLTTLYGLATLDASGVPPSDGGLMTPKTVQKRNLPRAFGVFSPTGYVVLAFPKDADATKAREALLGGGYDEDEILQATAAEVQTDIESTRPAVSVLATLGTDLEHQDVHLEAAKQGHAFLLVYAPSEAETSRVMRVARRFHVRLAHKYNRLTVEDLA
jgi:hypothetical protein